REDRRSRDKRRPDRKGPRPSFDRPGAKGKPGERPRRHDRRPPRGHDRQRQDRPRPNRQSSASAARTSDRPLPPIAVKFLPRASAFENVVAQIKSGSIAYSLFALARLFLEKATRHDVLLTAPPESPLFQLGGKGDVSVDRQLLERTAFRFGQADFYK